MGGVPRGCRLSALDGLPTRPELAGSFGMAAGTHWLAAAVAMSILERGGNAADAAVAGGFVLQVVEPHLNGPAGEVPIIVSAPDGETEVICGQGTAPAAATLGAFADLGLSQIPGTGLLAAAIPGAFGAWTLLLERHGTMTLEEVLSPAIGYALDGAPVLPRVAGTIAGCAELFRTQWQTSAAVYTPHGRPPEAWSRLRLTDLGRCYQRILVEARAAGPDRVAQLRAARAAWYQGFVAEEIDAFCRDRPWLDSSGERHRGLLSGSDLAGWEPTVEPPVIVEIDGVEVCKPGPWSAGPVLGQQLRLLAAGGGLAGLGDLALDDPDWVHLLIECQKLAYADREAWYGDPPAVDIPLQTLLSSGYAERRRELVDPAVADLRLRPGSPDGRVPVLPRMSEYDARGNPVPGLAPGLAQDPVDDVPLGVGEPTRDSAEPTRGDTCHLDVVDRWGRMVSATPSGGWLQSSPVVPGLGFPLGTRLQMCRLQDGLAATLRPGTRPRTTLSPTLLRRGGRGWIALGTPGGDQQDQWSLLLVLRLLAQARSGGPLQLQAAIDAPALHTEHTPSSFYPRSAAPGRVVLEGRWPTSVIEELTRRGHRVQVGTDWSLGRLSAVAREPGGWLRAAANPRGAQGYAAGR